MTLKARTASRADLPEVLRLYAQPGFDDGKVLHPYEIDARCQIPHAR